MRQQDVGVQMQNPVAESKMGETEIDACCFAEGRTIVKEGIRQHRINVVVTADPLRCFVLVRRDNHNMVKELLVVMEGLLQKVAVFHTDDDGLQGSSPERWFSVIQIQAHDFFFLVGFSVMWMSFKTSVILSSMCRGAVVDRIAEKFELVEGKSAPVR